MPNNSIEAIFKRKSAATYKAAALLANGNINSAANRAYYCLYQALVGEMEKLGVRPEQIDAGSARAAAQDQRLKWTHSFIKNNASLAGLEPEECSIVRLAYELRSDADYGVREVNPKDFAEVMQKLAAILEGLGVSTKGTVA